MDGRLKSLVTLLEERLRVIADHDHRDRDPAGHLARLREVSESITATFESLSPKLNARLRHYFAQASYDKALAHLKAGSG
jgi:hypothetical protein